MNKVAIYPGTFDPITYGHIDVIKKGLKLFDKIVVGVSDVSSKNYLFSSDERIDIVNKALFKDLRLNKKKIYSKSKEGYFLHVCALFPPLAWHSLNMLLQALRSLSNLKTTITLLSCSAAITNPPSYVWMIDLPTIP